MGEVGGIASKLHVSLLLCRAAHIVNDMHIFAAATARRLPDPPCLCAAAKPAVLFDISRDCFSCLTTRRHVSLGPSLLVRRIR